MDMLNLKGIDLYEMLLESEKIIHDEIMQEDMKVVKDNFETSQTHIKLSPKRKRTAESDFDVPRSKRSRPSRQSAVRAKSAISDILREQREYYILTRVNRA